jgi:hypothetical protein
MPLSRSTGLALLFATHPITSTIWVSVETRNLRRADQTNPVANTDNSDGAPLSIAESSGQILVLALSSPGLGEDGPVMVDISNFTTAKILDKQSSPFGVKYRCELEPLCLPGDLVGKVSSHPELRE